MPYTIEYDPDGKRITMPGIKVLQVVAKAEALVAGGATDVRIIGQEGKPIALAQFKAELAQLIVDA